MEKVLDAFFALLRAGLLHKPVALRGEIPWQEVYTLATQQSMLGIVFDGVSLLPEGQQPPKALLIKWMGIVAHLEQKNELLNQRVVELQALYEAEHIPFVLLKGQGLALNYPNPDHRTCGDMDVFVSPDYFERANTVLRAAGGIQGTEEGVRHLDFEWRGVMVENHRIMSVFHQEHRNDAFLHWIASWFPQGAELVTLKGASVAVPPVLFNVVYVLHHALRHLLTSGLGLRQPLDWLLLVRKHREELNKEVLKEALLRFDVYALAQAVAYLGVHHLGFKAEELPIDLPRSDKLARLLLKDILLSGNFGQFDVRKGARARGRWAAKWQTFTGMLHRIYRLHRLAPKESWGIPWYLLKNRMAGKRG